MPNIFLVCWLAAIDFEACLLDNFTLQTFQFYCLSIPFPLIFSASFVNTFLRFRAEAQIYLNSPNLYYTVYFYHYGSEETIFLCHWRLSFLGIFCANFTQVINILIQHFKQQKNKRIKTSFILKCT